MKNKKILTITGIAVAVLTAGILGNNSELFQGFMRSIPQEWNVEKVYFDNEFKYSKVAREVELSTAAVFQYLGPNNKDLSFDEQYIWNMNCSIVFEPEVDYFEQNILFPTGQNSTVTLENKDYANSRSKITIPVQDYEKAKSLNKNMNCSLGFSKPLEYQDVLFGINENITMSYIIDFQTNNTVEVTSWDF